MAKPGSAGREVNMTLDGIFVTVALLCIVVELASVVGCLRRIATALEGKNK